MPRRQARSKSIANAQGANPKATPALVSSAAIVPVEAQVRIRNLHAQMMQCSVLTEDGRSHTLRLGAHAVSQPYNVSRIDSYTHMLVERGHLKIEPAH